MTTIDLTPDFEDWVLSVDPPDLVLAPVETYEGSKVLDPFIYEEDGQLYLVYSANDEMAIAIARLGFIPHDGDVVMVAPATVRALHGILGRSAV